MGRFDTGLAVLISRPPPSVKGMPTGVFEDMKSGDIHVAPVENAKTGSSYHTFEGVSCWCGPHRQEDTPALILHNEPQ